MDLSLIKEILIKNQLIRGRLSLTPAEIQKLYRTKLRQNQKIQIELSKKKDIVTSSLNQIKNLKSELKYCEETLQKAFQPSTENISLIYKNISNNFYIKARFYWQGEQREVQVGSIPIVLDMIQRMLGQKYLQNIIVQKAGQMTWEQFKNKANLVKATKEIAALKFQEYIIRKLSVEDMEECVQGDMQKRTNKEPEITSHLHTSVFEKKEKGEFDWYVQWRNNNLK